MTLDQLQAENRQLKAELARLRAQLQKAYKARADIHARLRSLTSSTSHLALLTSHSSPP